MTATTAPAAAPVVVTRSASPLAGTGTLIRFILRRDRVRLPIWIGAIVLFTIGSVSSIPGLFQDDSDFQARADLMRNPGTRAISGPGYGLDDYNAGAMTAHEYFSWVAIFTALMSILLIVRHTRAEEETGRSELIRSAVVGRHAQTTAALIVVGAAQLVIGVLLALGVGSLGIEDLDAEGAWLFGLGLAGVGLVFAAVTAVTAQVSEHARTAGGLAGAALAVTYSLRAAGDMSAIGGGPLSWLSPIGWGQQTRMWVDDRWWPLGFHVVLTVILVAVAYALSSRRDFGAGLIQSRPGSPTASPLLSSPLGLAWRLDRASVMWWAFALIVFAGGYGSLASEIETFAEDFSLIENLEDAYGGAIIDAFLATIMSLIAAVVAIFAILTVNKLRSEEVSGRAEPVLATATSRTRWVGSHLLISLAASTIVLALSGLAIGASAGAAVNDSSLAMELFGAALAYAPAVWVTVGIWIFLFGIFPRATALVWVVIAYAALIGTYAVVLGLPEWTVNLSPFGHVPALPAEGMNWVPLFILTGLAAILLAVGMKGFGRRDLTTK